MAPKDRRIIERFIDHEIEEGRQVFVICPLISESDELAEVRNVEAGSEETQTGIPAQTHRHAARQITAGRKTGHYADLSGEAIGYPRLDVRHRSRDRHSNATIILIEGAERFGLAQLHQLRGRVGRSDHKSYCFLFTTSESQARSIRLKAMEQHDSGFMLAEIDLKLRGPGELYGLRQSDPGYGTRIAPEP